MLSEFDGRTRRRDHEHAVVGAEDFVVDVDADNGVGTQLLGAFTQFAHGGGAGLDEFIFVGGAAAADKVADAGSDVVKEVDAGDHFAENDALVFNNGASGGGGGENHSPVFDNAKKGKTWVICNVPCLG